MLVLLALACALGVYAAMMIPRQEDPSFYNPSVDITVVYPGADPADIERLAVDPIEDVLVELDNVKELRFTSENGVAELMIEFAWGEDPLRRYDEVVREINALRPQLPGDITEIRFRRFNPNLVNIVQFAITAPAATPLELKNLAEDLEELIETVPGIRRADISGIPFAGSQRHPGSGAPRRAGHGPGRCAGEGAQRWDRGAWRRGRIGRAALQSDDLR